MWLLICTVDRKVQIVVPLSSRESAETILAEVDLSCDGDHQLVFVPDIGLTKEVS